MTTDPPQPDVEAERRDRAARWREEEARRRAICAGAADWQDCARRLHAAGELSAGLLAALGLEPKRADQ